MKIDCNRPDGAPAPTTIAGALRLAIADVRAIAETERSRAPAPPGTVRHIPNADTWYFAVPDTGFGPSCEACLAGMIMARGISAPPDREYTPGHFTPAWEKTFEALDAARVGAWADAAMYMYPRVTEEQADAFDARILEITGSRRSAFSAFHSWDDLLRLVDELEERWLPAAQRAEQSMNLTP